MYNSVLIIVFKRLISARKYSEEAVKIPTWDGEEYTNLHLNLPHYY